MRYRHRHQLFPVKGRITERRVLGPQWLKRVSGIDVEKCRISGGTAKVIACSEDPVVVKKLLVYLGEKKSGCVSPVRVDPGEW